MVFTSNVFEIELNILVTVIAETAGFPFLQFCLMKFCCQYCVIEDYVRSANFIPHGLFLLPLFALFFHVHFLCKVAPIVFVE